ncbi:response regulator [Cohnella abietis]|uniref:DNA-binding response regulator n=1 Tax=Cohnella abietis TaxID=2507935 RepID=A0A3T1DC41_9BACL|nr:response regulator [Cohnella abietis]BBI35528.1 hypothetical protein KCTCHS21_49270 [Cohnella abietis]
MNLNILIVEDEPPIARSLKIMIEQFPNMKVVACAAQGVEALKWLEREEIDIVFTDISMPVMGGIELMSKIHDQYPDIVTVVVSGYQEFEYVRSALQYKAFDYMLKPVFKPDLHQLLDKIGQTIRISKKAIQKRQLLGLLNRTPRAIPFHDALPSLPWYTVAVVCAGTLPNVYSDSKIPAREYWSNIEWNDVLSLGNEAHHFWVLDGRTAAEKVIVGAFMRMEDRLLLEQLYAKLPEDLFVTMVIGPAMAQKEEIAEMNDALRSILYRTVSIGQSQICFVEASELKDRSMQEQRLMLDSSEIESLVLNLNRAQLDAAEQTLRDLFDRCSEKKVPQAELESLLLQIVHRVARFSAGQDVNLIEVEIEIGETIMQAVSYESLLKDAIDLFEKVGKQYKAEDIPPIVLDVEQYIQEHYAESITNIDLSKRFGFVPSYITKLFRAHRGMSPSQYMTRIRLEKAKEIIRSQPRLMLKEIAEMVGYNDPLYFSRVFHKEVGVWPSEYKQG